MLFLIGIFILHISAIVLLLVATIDNAWWVTDTMRTDVWGRWLKINGVWNLTDLPTGTDYPQDYLHAVQATSVLACIFSFIAAFVFLAQLFTLPKGQRFTITGAFQLLACEYFFDGVPLTLVTLPDSDEGFLSSGVFIMIAASIYTNRFHVNESQGSYGHSYILAWIAFGLSFVSSITYFVLRKKSA